MKNTMLLSPNLKEPAQNTMHLSYAFIPSCYKILSIKLEFVDYFQEKMHSVHVNSKINCGHLPSPNLAKIGQGNKNWVSLEFQAVAFTLLTILALEESITDALARVPVKLPMPRAVAGTEMSQVKFVG